MRTAMTFSHIILHPAISYKDCISFTMALRFSDSAILLKTLVLIKQCIGLQVNSSKKVSYNSTISLKTLFLILTQNEKKINRKLLQVSVACCRWSV